MVEGIIILDESNSNYVAPKPVKYNVAIHQHQHQHLASLDGKYHPLHNLIDAPLLYCMSLEALRLPTTDPRSYQAVVSAVATRRHPSLQCRAQSPSCTFNKFLINLFKINYIKLCVCVSVRVTRNTMQMKITFQKDNPVLRFGVDLFSPSLHFI